MSSTNGNSKLQLQIVFLHYVMQMYSLDTTIIIGNYVVISITDLKIWLQRLNSVVTTSNRLWQSQFIGDSRSYTWYNIDSNTSSCEYMFGSVFLPPGFVALFFSLYFSPVPCYIYTSHIRFLISLFMFPTSYYLLNVPYVMLSTFGFQLQLSYFQISISTNL